MFTTPPGIGTEDGYWFAHDPETMVLEVFHREVPVGTATNCDPDSIGDVFNDIVEHDRRKQLH